MPGIYQCFILQIIIIKNVIRAIKELYIIHIPTIKMYSTLYWNDVEYRKDVTTLIV